MSHSLSSTLMKLHSNPSILSSRTTIPIPRASLIAHTTQVFPSPRPLPLTQSPPHKVTFLTAMVRSQPLSCPSTSIQEQKKRMKIRRSVYMRLHLRRKICIRRQRGWIRLWGWEIRLSCSREGLLRNRLWGGPSSLYRSVELWDKSAKHLGTEDQTCC